MIKTVNTLPTIPAQRYFSLDEVCYLAQVSPDEFAQWQKEHGALGYGGHVFSRQDVITTRRLKATFLPFVDPFTENHCDADGNLAMSGKETAVKLNELLEDIQAVLAK